MKLRHKQLRLSKINFFCSLREKERALDQKTQELNKLKADLEQAEQKASVALEKAQEDLTQAQAIRSSELASLKVEAGKAAAAAAQEAELRYAEVLVEKETFAKQSSTLEERVAQLEATLSLEREDRAKLDAELSTTR